MNSAREKHTKEKWTYSFFRKSEIFSKRSAVTSYLNTPKAADPHSTSCRAVTRMYKWRWNPLGDRNMKTMLLLAEKFGILHSLRNSMCWCDILWAVVVLWWLALAATFIYLTLKAVKWSQKYFCTSVFLHYKRICCYFHQYKSWMLVRTHGLASNQLKNYSRKQNILRQIIKLKSSCRRCF